MPLHVFASRPPDFLRLARRREYPLAVRGRHVAVAGAVDDQYRPGRYPPDMGLGPHCRHVDPPPEPEQKRGDVKEGEGRQVEVPPGDFNEQVAEIRVRRLENARGYPPVPGHRGYAGRRAHGDPEKTDRVDAPAAGEIIDGSGNIVLFAHPHSADGFIALPVVPLVVQEQIETAAMKGFHPPEHLVAVRGYPVDHDDRLIRVFFGEVPTPQSQPVAGLEGYVFEGDTELRSASTVHEMLFIAFTRFWI